MGLTSITFDYIDDIPSFAVNCVFNPLSPNVADLQHFDIVVFCGFSLRNAFRPSSELFTGSLLVVPFSQGLVKKVASSPGPTQILSRSRGEKSGEGLGAKLRHGPEMVDSVST